MFIVDDDEPYLVCALCHHRFTTLARAWLASPVTGGEAIWAHRGCLDGRGTAILGTDTYRLRRADYALHRLLTRMLHQTLI